MAAPSRIRPIMQVQEAPPYSLQADHHCAAEFPCNLSLAVDLYGLRVDVRTNDASLLESFPAHLPVGWQPANTNCVDRVYTVRAIKERGADRESRFVLWQDDRLLADLDDRWNSLQILENDLERYVAECAPHRVFVHAGVVGWRGRAIVIPGKSFSGKSSLVATLCQLGADYYSDEFAVLDFRGRVHPYCRPLHLREAIPHVAVPGQVNSSRPATPKPLPIGLVVLTWFQSNAAWNPQLLSPGRSLLHLMANTMCTQHRPQMALDFLRQSLRSACIIQSPRGEASSVAHTLLALASGEGFFADIGTLPTSDGDSQRSTPESSHEPR